MKTRYRKGLATAGLTAVLGATAIVIAPAPALAVTGSAEYTCQTPIGPATVPVSVSSDLLPSSVATGFTVPGGLLPVTTTVTVPASLAGTLKGFGVTALGGGSEDFDLGLGPVAVPIDSLTSAPVTIVDGEDVVLTANATVGSFTTPAPGTQALTLPAGFTFTPTNQDGNPLPTLTCSITDPLTAQFGSVKVTKQTSTTTAKATKATIKKSERATIKTTVVRQFDTPGVGKVTVKDGTKQVGAGTLKGGVATIKLASLAPGKHKLVVKYLGNATTAASKVVVTVTVKQN